MYFRPDRNNRLLTPGASTHLPGDWTCPEPRRNMPSLYSVTWSYDCWDESDKRRQCYAMSAILFNDKHSHLLSARQRCRKKIWITKQKLSNNNNNFKMGSCIWTVSVWISHEHPINTKQKITYPVVYHSMSASTRFFLIFFIFVPFFSNYHHKQAINSHKNRIIF